MTLCLKGHQKYSWSKLKVLFLLSKSRTFNLTCCISNAPCNTRSYRVFNLKVTIFNHRLQTLVFQISCSSLRFSILTWVHLILFARFGIFNIYIKIFNQSQSDNSITKIRSKKIYFKLWPLWSCLKIVSRLLSSKRDFPQCQDGSKVKCWTKIWLFWAYFGLIKNV